MRISSQFGLLILSLVLLGIVTASERQLVPAEATVETFKVAAMEDRMAGGESHSFDSVTFTLASPSAIRGKTVTVFYPSGSVPADSPLRRVGARFQFDFDVANLTATHLFGGALQKLRCLDPK
jgi:hypothetical protein